MGAKYWSASNLAFYDSDITAVTAMPSDKVALTDSEYNALIAAQTAGKKITHNSSTGKPQATDQGLTAATGTALDTLNSKVVHLAGNETITGQKTFSATVRAGLEGFVTSNSDDKAVRISGGTGYEAGASLIVYGKNHAEYPGYLRIRTTNGTDVADLDAAPNGSLTWDGHNIVRSVNNTNADAAGNVSITTVSGNAGSATKLATARTIDGVDFNGTAAITHYGTCSTAAGTAAKVVALTGFKLVTGARVIVRFTVTNTAASPTLNVNSTGAKAIQYRNAAIAAGYLAANRVYEFVYDGSAYELVGDVDTNTTSYLPLAGGTMTGSIKTAVEGIIVGTNTTSGRRISGGTGWDDGASVVVYGKDHATYPGMFRIKADDGTNEAILLGKPDGTLTWGGASVTTFPAGTQMLFAQSAAPTGWTKQTTVNDAAIRVVSGSTGGGTGGSVAFATAFKSHSVSVSGTTGATTLTAAQLAAHYHLLAVATSASAEWQTNPTADNFMGTIGNGGVVSYHGYSLGGGSGTPNRLRSGGVNGTSSSSSHTHSFSGSATVNLTVKYLDVIICKKN